MHRLGDRGQFRRLSAREENGLGRERATGLASRKEPLTGALPSPVSGQHFAERWRQHDLPVFAAFAASHPDNPAAAIKIVYVQPGYFRYPEPCAVHGRQDGPVAEVCRRRQQRFDLFPAQNDREFLLAAWHRNAVDVELPVQGMAVKETQSADGLNVCRRADLLLVEQVQLVLPDLLRAELVRRLVEVCGELGDRADVTVHRRRCIVADAEIFQHSLPE